MNFQFYLEKLENSDTYRDFIKENPDAFLCSAFFSIDKQGEDNQQHVDFFIPETSQMISFKLENGIEKIPLENFSGVPEKISEKCDFELYDVEALISKEMNSRDEKAKMKKIFLSLQKKDGKNFLIGTIFISALGIIRINIDLSDMKVTLFEKNSFMDMIKIVKKDKKE